MSGPLNADFHIGFEQEHDKRVADLVPWEELQEGDLGYNETDPNSIFNRVFSNPVVPPEQTKTREWRAAEIPAAGGHGNARSVARIASAIACGGEVDDIRLLKMETIKKAMEEQHHFQDLVMLMPIRFGVGFGLPSKEMPFPNPNTVFWGGAGGSIVVMDLDKKLSFSYVMNQMKMTTTGDMRSARLMMSLYAGLSK